MKRKKLVKIHLTAAITATLTILSFILSSALAEISREETIIKNVKKIIFFTVPLLLVIMPTLGISGNKLTGKSRNPIVLAKKKRMKLIFINGMMLIGLAAFLYYRSLHQGIDNVFLIFQIAEFAFGIINLFLISMNIKDGLRLSGRLKEVKPFQIH
jgi:hypothetical protein